MKTSFIVVLAALAISALSSPVLADSTRPDRSRERDNRWEERNGRHGDNGDDTWRQDDDTWREDDGGWRQNDGRRGGRQSGYSNFNRMIANFEMSIRQGYRQGDLTNQEVRHLRGKLRDLRERYMSYRDDGLSSRERTILQRQTIQLRKAIERESNDNQVR